MHLQDAHSTVWVLFAYCEFDLLKAISVLGCKNIQCEKFVLCKSLNVIMAAFFYIQPFHVCSDSQIVIQLSWEMSHMVHVVLMTLLQELLAVI